MESRGFVNWVFSNDPNLIAIGFSAVFRAYQPLCGVPLPTVARVVEGGLCYPRCVLLLMCRCVGPLVLLQCGRGCPSRYPFVRRRHEGGDDKFFPVGRKQGNGQIQPLES
ncbi:unnamed protein product [Brassica oleracea var. botrytis]